MRSVLKPSNEVLAGPRLCSRSMRSERVFQSLDQRGIDGALDHGVAVIADTVGMELNVGVAEHFASLAARAVPRLSESIACIPLPVR